MSIEYFTSKFLAIIGTIWIAITSIMPFRQGMVTKQRRNRIGGITEQEKERRMAKLAVKKMVKMAVCKKNSRDNLRVFVLLKNAHQRAQSRSKDDKLEPRP